MSDSEKLQELQLILAPAIDWYKNVIEEGEPDSSYLYDTTVDVVNDNLSRGNFQRIVEILL